MKRRRLFFIFAKKQIADMSPQAKNKLARDLNFKARFDELYNKERLRVDDVWQQLEKEYFINKITLQRRLRSIESRLNPKPTNQLSISF
jgi:hypothetical protein